MKSGADVQGQREIIDAGLAAVLSHLDPAPLAGKKLFITGGTGFFGLWLLSALAMLNARGAGISVTVLSRDPVRFFGSNPQWRDLPWLSFAKGNVRDFDFPQTSFDLLIHAAADTLNAYADPLGIFDDIVIGTRRVLDFARASGIKRTLMTSSGAVYGVQPADVSHIPEAANYACAPNLAANAYGEGKRAMEMLAALYQQQYGIESVIARCFAFAGPGLSLDGHFAIGNFIRDGLYAETIEVKGDGTPLRSYLYGADLAVWLLTLLAKGNVGFPYNTGSDQAISIADLAETVRRCVASEKKCHIQLATRLATRAENAAPSRYVPAIDRARNELKLDVWTTLQQAIEWTAAYHRCASVVS